MVMHLGMAKDAAFFDLEPTIAEASEVIRCVRCTAPVIKAAPAVTGTLAVARRTAIANVWT
jgi:hypothetical protein